jgi:glycosyltransferase involved in cell wall biosynthesis
MPNEKRKICILLPTHWAARMGGAQYQAMILVEYLVSTGKFDVYYLARRTNDAFQANGYRVVKIPGPDTVRPYRFFETTFSLLKILGSIKPDYIYQQTGCAYTGIAAYYARKNRCKMVWRVSSDKNLLRQHPRLSRNLLYEGIDSTMMSYGIRNAGAIIVQTPHQGRLLEQNYCRKPDAVVRNFHPYPDEKPDKHLPVKVLWIANFKKLKQPEIFIRLARDMADIDDVRFIMIGASAPESKWSSLLDNEINSISNLSHTGNLPQEEVNRMISESHILVNTSQYEGFSNTFIQAWMRKVPVISLNVDPDGILNRYKVGFCAGGDYSKLLSYTKTLVNDHALLRKMGDSSSQYAFEFYSLRNVDQIVDILIE